MDLLPGSEEIRFPAHVLVAIWSPDQTDQQKD